MDNPDRYNGTRLVATACSRSVKTEDIIQAGIDVGFGWNWRN